MTKKTVFKKLPKGCQKVVTKIMNMLMYNSVLRFAIQTFQGQFLAAVLALKILTLNIHAASATTLIIQGVTLMVLLGFFVFQAVFVMRNRENLHKASIANRFDSLYKDVNLYKPGRL